MTKAFARCPKCRSQMSAEVQRGEVSWHCTGCKTDWPIPRRLPTEAELEETRTVVTVAECIDCNETKRIHARARCATCYKHWWLGMVGATPAIGSPVDQALVASELAEDTDDGGGQ